MVIILPHFPGLLGYLSLEITLPMDYLRRVIYFAFETCFAESALVSGGVGTLSHRLILVETFFVSLMFPYGLFGRDLGLLPLYIPDS